MKDRFWLLGSLAFMLVLAGTAAPALAKGDYHGGGLKGKLFHKAHYILENKEALGLSGQQVDRIKSLKMETKRSLIRLGAEKKLAGLDVKEAMYDHPIDEEAFVELVQQKYAIKQQKAVAVARAFVQLKNTLSGEQYAALKDLWKKDKK